MIEYPVGVFYTNGKKYSPFKYKSVEKAVQQLFREIEEDRLSISDVVIYVRGLPYKIARIKYRMGLTYVILVGVLSKEHRMVFAMANGEVWRYA